MQMPELAFFVLTLPFAFWAAWSDLRDMKIRNRMNLALFAVFLVSGLLLLPLGDYLTRLGIAAAALVVGFVLNAIGKLGGGDAKFIAAFIPFIDPGRFSAFLMVLAMCLLAAVVVHRVAKRIPAITRATPHWVSWTRKSYFPMGLGLAPGFSLTLAIEAFNLPFGPG